MSTTTPLSLDVAYARTIKSYFSWNREEETLCYWYRFATAEGFDPANPPQDVETNPETLQSKFEKFLESYKELGISPQAIKMGASIPTDSYIQSIFTTYLSSFSEVQRQDLWNQFLFSQNIDSALSLTPYLEDQLASFVKIATTKTISNALNDYFGEKAESLRILLLDRYAKSKGETSALFINVNSEVEADFRSFLQRYVLLEADKETLLLNNPLPASTGFYQNYIESFFGNISEIELEDIWNLFLKSYGYSYTPVDSEKVQQQLAQYIQSISGKFSLSANLSPHELEARSIFSALLESLQKYLNESQTHISIKSATLVIYGKLQQNYTEMMTRIPNLTGGAQPKVEANSSDLEKFRFGYNDISLQDVINWGVYSALASSSKFVFGNRSPGTTPNGYTYLTGEYSFKVIKPSENEKSIVIGIAEESSGVDAKKIITISDPSNPDFSAITDSVSQNFKDLFAEKPEFISAINGQGGIPGRYLGVEDTTTGSQNEQQKKVDENTNQIQLRAEVNAILQQSVENVRSRRDTVQNSAKQEQATLQELKDGLDKQTSLMTSILESIDSILQAINKK